MELQRFRSPDNDGGSSRHSSKERAFYTQTQDRHRAFRHTYACAEATTLDALLEEVLGDDLACEIKQSQSYDVQAVRSPPPS